ncbi:hypothetical protein BDZ97DRAFT_1922219 [Flammula alnicola]|nr:hypothetical protein BDZ97DRAFT_1922219 [Flammula alnicola]
MPALLEHYLRRPSTVHIKICDFAEAFLWDNTPQKVKMHIPCVYAAPELIFHDFITGFLPQKHIRELAPSILIPEVLHYDSNTENPLQGPYILKHRPTHNADTHYPTIIWVGPPSEVTRDWEVSGVLDWDGCEIAPAEIAYLCPGWLWASHDDPKDTDSTCESLLDWDPDERVFNE